MNNEIFEMKLTDLQPSQLYINQDKLAKVKQFIEDSGIGKLETIPIKELDGIIIMTDGHTRAFALYKLGFTSVNVCWEDEQLDWDEYRECIKWCNNEKIRTINDLEDKIISHQYYQILWLKRCHDMQVGLQIRKKKDDVQK